MRSHDLSVPADDAMLCYDDDDDDDYDDELTITEWVFNVDNGCNYPCHTPYFLHCILYQLHIGLVVYITVLYDINA